jgi:hypothetical protein
MMHSMIQSFIQWFNDSFNDSIRIEIKTDRNQNGKNMRIPKIIHLFT